jgi:WD repeat-containing protein 48
MAPGKAALRVSYVIPEPTHHPARLQLPRLGVDRHGSTTPLLIPAQTDGAGGRSTPLTVASTPNGHPRHRLGVNSLALDTSTQLSGNATPEGILYSGGRDGMIIAHELRIPHKKRAHMTAVVPHRWETLVGFHNPHTEEEPGPVGIEEIPYINAWEMDTNRFEPSYVRLVYS